jgi:rod shape-determining protein MreD
MRQPQVSGLRLFLSLILFLILTIIPLPNVMMGIRPPWVLMLILYIEIYVPNYFSVILTLFVGICVDVLLSTAIGEHSFALLLTAWIASGKLRQFRFYSIIQQMLLIAVLSFMYQLDVFLIDGLLGYNYSIWIPCMTALSALIVWPWMRMLLEKGMTHNAVTLYK